MKLTIYENKCNLIVLYSIISFTLFCISFFTPDNSIKIQEIGIIALIIGVLTELVYILISRKIVTYSNIYLIVLYVFHFGQVVINGVNPSHLYSNIDLVDVLGVDEYIAATTFSLAFFIICAITIFYFEGKYIDSLNRSCIYIQSEHNQNALSVGILITCITLPINFYINLNAIKASASGNYFDSFEIGTTGVQSAFAAFLIIGITLIMIAISYSKVKTFFVYVISVIYYSWTILSGGRGAAVIAIVFLTYILLKTTRVTMWKLVLFLVIAVFAMNVLSSIAMIRDSGGITLDKIRQTGTTIGNPVASMLEEMGGTLQTVGLSIRWSKTNLFKFGLTYLESLLSILPNLSTAFANINSDAIFTIHLPGSYLGGSVIGEAYYNFGYIGAFMGVPVGYIIGKMSSNVEEYFQKKEYMKIAYYIMPCYEALWWVRDTFSSMCRNTVWAIFLIYFMNYFIDSIRVSDRKDVYN